MCLCMYVCMCVCVCVYRILNWMIRSCKNYEISIKPKIAMLLLGNKTKTIKLI